MHRLQPAGLAGLQKKNDGTDEDAGRSRQDMSPGAKERIKLLQLQLQACQLQMQQMQQMQQLQADAAQQALLKMNREAPDGQVVATVQDVTSPLGSNIDTRA